MGRVRLAGALGSEGGKGGEDSQTFKKCTRSEDVELLSIYTPTTPVLYLNWCSSASSWLILDWSCGTDSACSWIIRTFSSPSLRASLASSARLLMKTQNHPTAFSTCIYSDLSFQLLQPDQGVLLPQGRLHPLQLVHFLVSPP